MSKKIFAQVTIKPSSRTANRKSAKMENSEAPKMIPSKVQLNKAEKKLMEAGCEITSKGPTIGIAMEVSAFDVLFGTKMGEDPNRQQLMNEIVIPEKLKDIIADVAIATLPDYF